MPDPYVKALIYWIWHGRLTDYDNPQPVSFEETDFDVQVENRKVTFTFKKEFETEKQAREAVRHYINEWEFSAGLEHGPDAFRLHFEKAVVMEKNPPVSGGIRAWGTLGSARGSATPARQRLASYPTPPSEITVTPEAQWAFDRYMRYRQGTGGLPEAAYFCLTVLESSVPEQARQRPKKATATDAARWYGISSSVLSSTRRLSSAKGGPEARKADGIGKELYAGERIFLEQATEAIIRGMAERAHDPDRDLPKITMPDLPPLPENSELE